MTTSPMPPIPPQTSSMPPALATRSSRFVARIVDGFIIGLVGVPFWMTAVTSTGENVGLFFILGIAATIAVIGYQIKLLWKEGQTIGKKMFHIRIVLFDSGTNGGFVPNVLLREVVNAILGVIPVYGLIDALFIFRADKRCIHDLIAGTTVVQAS